MPAFTGAPGLAANGCVHTPAVGGGRQPPILVAPRWSRWCVTAAMAPLSYVAPALLLVLLSPVEGTKLKITDRECMTKKVEVGDHVSGSFVAMAGGRGMFGGRNVFNLEVSDPNGNSELKVHGRTSYKFNFKAKETGRYEFCIINARDRVAKKQKHEGSYAEVVWELHVGHVNVHDKAQEEHVDDLWDSIDALEERLDVMHMEQLYYKNKELVQEEANRALSSRVLTFAVLRSVGLIGVSIAQVMFIRWLFAKRSAKGMLG